MANESEKLINEVELQEEFEIILSGFSRILLAKLMANERKYHFGNAWKIPNWETELQRGLVEHTQKGDPRDVAIYALFAWFHGWKTGTPHNDVLSSEESDEQLAAKTARNMDLISVFIDHVKEETGVEVPESALLSFFNA